MELDFKYGTDRSIFLHGAADLRGVRAIEKVMKLLSPRTAWDVGANRGNHSAFMRRQCRRLFSFEPNPSEAQRLRALFENDAGVTIFEAALSDDRGERSFFIDEAETGNSTLEVDPSAANAVVQTTTGDEVVSNAAVRDLDFIKIDVEGHEANVLRGLTNTLQSQRPVIVLEVLQAQSRPGNIADLLPSGYELYGNRRSFMSGLTMSAYQFCRFDYGRTFMCAMAVPKEKRSAIASLLPKPSRPGAC